MENSSVLKVFPFFWSVDGKDIFLKDIWPSQNEIEEIIENTIDPVMFSKAYKDSIQGLSLIHI